MNTDYFYDHKWSCLIFVKIEDKYILEEKKTIDIKNETHIDLHKTHTQNTQTPTKNQNFEINYLTTAMSFLYLPPTI